LRRLRRQFDRGGFGFKAELLGSDLIGRLVPMPLSQPGRIVEGGELGQMWLGLSEQLPGCR
jgi:hypothetical protein